MKRRQHEQDQHTCAEAWRIFTRSACMSVTAWSNSFRGSSSSRTAHASCISMTALSSQAHSLLAVAHRQSRSNPMLAVMQARPSCFPLEPTQTNFYDTCTLVSRSVCRHVGLQKCKVHLQNRHRRKCTSAQRASGGQRDWPLLPQQRFWRRVELRLPLDGELAAACLQRESALQG